MKKILEEITELGEELPSEIIDEIQIKMVVWSGREFIKLGVDKPSETQIELIVKRSFDKFLELLRDAKSILDETRGE